MSTVADHYILYLLSSKMTYTTGSAVAAASDIHRQLPTHMADIRRDWLTNQNTDLCFVVIGLGRKTSHSPLQQLKIDPVRRTRPPYWLASSGGQRIFINICGQYGIQKNIYIHPWPIHSGTMHSLLEADRKRILLCRLKNKQTKKTRHFRPKT